MKILLICDRYPFPLTNGQNLRVFHLVRHLNAWNDIDLLCYGDGAVPAEVSRLFREVQTCPPPGADGCHGARTGGSWNPVSPATMIEGSTRFASLLEDRLGRKQYDLLWMEGWETVVNLPRSLNLPFLADIIDDGVLEYWNEFRASGWGMGRVRMAKRLLQNVLFERRYFSKADYCITVSERDAAVLRRVASVPVAVIHNGVDADYFQPSGVLPQPATLVFEGSMEFRPNVDAARRLVLEVLPLVRRERPDARVLLVGRDPAPGVLSLEADDVEVTGFVNDVRPYLEAGTVFVAPMRKGAGIKNKVLQAWAMAKPVVGTSTAMGGLRVVDGVNALVRDTPEAMAAAIVELLCDPERRRDIGEAGRRTVSEAYSWRQKAVELHELMSSVVKIEEAGYGAA
ncbi:MAG: glycosyltransferase [Gammaproteobacteria bacterium]